MFRFVCIIFYFAKVIKIINVTINDFIILLSLHLQNT